MTESTTETSDLPLFNHTARKDWGVAVLVREEGGKRAYLFEDGEERTLASGYHQLMRRVEQPSVDQRAFYERQRAVLARREKASTSSAADGRTFLDQLETLHEGYPDGILDAKWIAEVRGEGAADRTPKHRDALVAEAREKLKPAALDPLLKGQSYGQVWDAVLSVLSHTDLVPAAQLKKPKGVKDDAMKALALAVKELLHGQAPYDQRFDGFLAAFTPVYGEAARWELATAVIAVYSPSEHICIHPAAFKQQLKVMGSRGSAPARATGAAYTRFLSVARLVAGKLREQNQEPRDMLDVYDFIRLTAAASKAGRLSVKSKAKGPAKAAAAPADDADSDGDSDE